MSDESELRIPFLNKYHLWIQAEKKFIHRLRPSPEDTPSRLPALCLIQFINSPNVSIAFHPAQRLLVLSGPLDVLSERTLTRLLLGAAARFMASQGVFLINGTALYVDNRFILFVGEKIVSHAHQGVTPVILDKEMNYIDCYGKPDAGQNKISAVYHLHVEHLTPEYRVYVKAKDRLIRSSHLISPTALQPLVIPEWQYFFSLDMDCQEERHTAIRNMAALPHFQVACDENTIDSILPLTFGEAEK